MFDGQLIPSFASADYRLGEFDAFTIGIKYGQEMRRGQFSSRLELYTQSGTPSSGSRVGALTAFDLYPDLNAIIAQFSYEFGR
jgi:hypothetical protein